MANDEEVIDDLVFPSGLADVDDLHEELTTTQHRGSFNRAHSLEPADFNLEMPCSTDDEIDESLQAALRFLDEAEGLESLTEDVEKAATSPVSSSTSVSAPEGGTETIMKGAIASQGAATSKPKRRHRVSAKQQIHHLRGAVMDLTEQLQSLESDISRSKGGEDKTSELVSRGPLWQQISSRQLERRQESERDNARLHAMLDMQVQEAKNLKRILKRRTRIEMMENMLGVKRHKKLASETPDDSRDILHEMLRSTDEIYVSVDHEFATKDMNQVDCPGKTRLANRQATNDVFLEIMEKQLVPFGPKSTEKAVWAALGQIGMQPLQCVRDVNSQVDFYAQDSQQTDDTMMISYVAAISGFQNSDIRAIRIRKVMRKYAEADRAVFICRMESKPQHLCERKGIKLSCSMRVVVEKAAPLEGDEEEMTLIKSHYSISRHAAQQESFEVYGDVDMAITAWDETISRVSGEVESFLLNEAMNGMNSTTSAARR